MDIIAHRGNHDGQGAPENTLEVFKGAWNLPLNGIELDIRLTSDNQIVVFHDADTGKLSNQKLTIADTPLKELLNVSINGRENKFKGTFKIPTLEDVLDQTPSDKKIYIELKVGGSLINQLCKIFENYQKLLKQITFIGFSKVPMQKVKISFPNNQVYLIYRKSDAAFPERIIQEALQCNVDGVDIQSCQQITKDFVDIIKEQGLSVHTYLITKYEKNSKKVLPILGSGVDSITTNRPQWLLECIKEKENS